MCEQIPRVSIYMFRILILVSFSQCIVTGPCACLANIEDPGKATDLWLNGRSQLEHRIPNEHIEAWSRRQLMVKIGLSDTNLPVRADLEEHLAKRSAVFAIQEFYKAGCEI